ncbi:MAG: serine hydrolase domain-containing protein [Acidobacteriota bacterium]
MRNLGRFVYLLALLFSAAQLTAETTGAHSGLAARIDRLMTASYAADEPGAAVIVVDDGEVVYRGARGMANLELGVPLTPDHVFRLGSITKQFTAVAILLLEERGKLSVQDPITKYLPDYPTDGHTITIEHLLTHTSGIFSYTSIPGYMDAKVQRDLTVDELIDEFDDQEMEFAPGERWSYSNSGYVLLGAIIEKVSGSSYADFIDEHIFTPLGMTASEYGGLQLIPKRAAGYARDGAGGYRNAPYLSMTQPHAAGSLLSTVDDLALWDRALDSDELLAASSRQRMFTPYDLAGGDPTTYGYGFVIDTFRGTRAISHGGGIFGFSTFAVRLPEEGVYVAVLSNGAPVDPGLIAQKLAALAIGKPLTE